jgi:hypothetical protein
VTLPLTTEFLETVKPVDRNWSMGVELVSPFLYTLIRCVKPRTVLEIGAGYSSLFILEALRDNAVEDEQNAKKMEGQVRSDEHTGLRRLLKGKHPLPLAAPDYYEREAKEPILFVIDDSSHPSTSAGKVTEVAKRLGLDAYLRFHEGDFRGASEKLGEEILPFDFVWFDCGGLDDFTKEYWSLINPHGGLLMIHSTLANPFKRSYVTDLRNRLKAQDGRTIEVLSLLEPHKWRQNSFTLIRLVSPELEGSYTNEG